MKGLYVKRFEVRLFIIIQSVKLNVIIKQNCEKDTAMVAEWSKTAEAIVLL